MLGNIVYGRLEHVENRGQFIGLPSKGCICVLGSLHINIDGLLEKSEGLPGSLLLGCSSLQNKVAPSIMQVEILHPPPAQIFCPICSCVFRQHQKHLHMTKHVSGKHPGCEVFLKCPVCCNKFTNAKFAGLHKCDPQSSPAN